MKINKTENKQSTVKAAGFAEISIDKGNAAITAIAKKHSSLAKRFANFEGESKQEEFWSDSPVGKENL